MTIDQIAGAAVVIVGLLGEDFDLEVAKGFTRVRHQQVYESFDWKAAQDIIYLPIDKGVSQIEVPNAENIVSARWFTQEGRNYYLDPVSETYLFESFPELLREGSGATGVPQYFITRYVPDIRNVFLAVAPTPEEAGGGVLLLIKRKFTANSVEPLIPNIDEVLLQFVVSDLWQYMRQVGRSDAVLAQAKELLQAAQARDVPSTPKPRTSKNLTPGGDTMAEMTDAVCDIIGRWEPDVRESVRDRIRREYRQLYDTFMLPESLLIARVALQHDQQQVILPHFMDRVIEVRTDNDGPLTQVTTLKNREIQYFFGTSKDIFEQSGEPLSYTMLPPVGVGALPPSLERLEIASSRPEDDAGVEVFIRGFTNTTEEEERVKYVPFEVGRNPSPSPEFTFEDLAPGQPQPQPGPPIVWTQSKNSYSSPNTITKPDTKGIITVRGVTSHRIFLRLKPKEHERKFLRIWLLPNKGAGSFDSVSHPGSILVLGKAKISPLVDERDSPQIRNVSNILINAAASSMFDRLGNADQSVKYAAKAAAETQTLIDAETKQNAYNPTITPYVDPGYSELDC